MKNQKLFKKDINATIAYAFGFKTKKELDGFIKNNKIDIRKFNNFTEFELTIERTRRKELMKTQYEQLKQLDNVRKQVRNIRKPKVIQTFTFRYIFYSDYDPEKNYTNSGKSDIIQDLDGNLYVKRDIRMTNTKDVNIKLYNNRRTFERDGKPFFDRLVKILEDADVHISDGITCIIVDQLATPSEADIKKETNVLKSIKNTGKYINLKKSDLFYDESEGGFYHKYIHYTVNEDAETFNEMFKTPKTPYGKDHYKNNSCFINILVDTYHESFKKCSKYKFNATYEDFCELLELDLKNDNIGLSINKSLKFFKKFNLSLFVVGVFGVIEAFKPETRNGYITPNCLYLLVTNGHCYKMNHQIESLSNKIWKMNEYLDEDMKNVKVSNLSTNYRIRNTLDVSYDVIYIKKLNDILTKMKKTDDDDKKVIKFVYEQDLRILLLEMVNSTPSYFPNVYMDGKKIMSLSFSINGIIGTIETSNNKHPCDFQLALQEEDYKTYHKTDDELYKAIFTTENMSHYHPSTLIREKKYKMGPMCGYFDTGYAANITYSGLDSRKAYTSDFCNMEYAPVYNYFDVWQLYDNHKVEDYTQYLVRCDDNVECTKMIFPDEESRVYGYLLNRIENVKYTILEYKRPSKLNPLDGQDLINKLWETKISDNEELDEKCKKHIFNTTSGLLEKKTNTKSFTKAFKNYDEAFYYQTVHGGEILTLGDTESIYKNERDLIYVLHKKESVELTNGFTPIKEMIYSIRALKNYQAALKLLQNGILVHGIKTDSLLFYPKYEKQVRKLFDFSNKMGCFRMEFKKELPTKCIERQKIQYEPLDTDIIQRSVEDEFDQKSINKLFKKDNTLILGVLPGVGKTTTAGKYKCNNKLFVSPYNKLCQELRADGFEAITLNMLLGFGKNDEQNLKMTPYDISAVDCIVFDEIFLYVPAILMKIDKFMKKNKHIKFLATGDKHQNSPIGINVYNNISNQEEYMTQCINLIFKNQLILKQCKRLKDEKQIERLCKLKKDILDQNKPVMDTLKKYKFKMIDDINDLQTKNNICYFKDRCEQVNKYVHNELVKTPKQFTLLNKVKYWKGLKITCKQFYKSKYIRLNVNYTYEIKSVGDKFFEIYEPVEKQKMKVDTKLIIKHFKLPYANTNHSVQGLTFKEDYTIFDCGCSYTNRNWLWVSLTRTDDLSKITIFKHSDTEMSNLERSKRRQYLAMKITGYVQQDKRAGREIDMKEYITPEWIKEQHAKQGHECIFCHCSFEMDIKNAVVTSNITADRINNKLGHTKTNCVLSCVDCNKSRSNK